MGFVMVSSIHLAVKTAASMLDGNHMVFQFLSDIGCKPFLYIIHGHDDDKKVFEPSCFCTNTKTKKITLLFLFMYMVVSPVMVELFS